MNYFLVNRLCVNCATNLSLISVQRDSVTSFRARTLFLRRQGSFILRIFVSLPRLWDLIVQQRLLVIKYLSIEAYKIEVFHIHVLSDHVSVSKVGHSEPAKCKHREHLDRKQTIVILLRTPHLIEVAIHDWRRQVTKEII